MKSNFVTSILFIGFIILSSCGSSDENETGFTGTNTALITTGSEVKTFNVEKAFYSYIYKQYYLLLTHEDEELTLHIRANDPDELVKTDLSSKCEFSIDYKYPAYIGSTHFNDNSINLNISEANKSGNSFSMLATANNVVLKSIIDESLVLDKIELSINYEILTTEGLDKISFKANGEEFTYYGLNGSAYYNNDNPDLNDKDLVLTANTADKDSRIVSYEGFSIVNYLADYPPVPKKVEGYSNGLRIFFVKREDYSCAESSVSYYGNGYNENGNIDASSYEITQVTERDTDYLLEGIFSGVITYSHGNNTINITEGSFHISVPK